MALAGTTAFEIRTDGDDGNSAGFNAAGSSPGTDRSQQAAAHVVIDGATITLTVHTTTTQVTLSGYTVSAADNRNSVKITGGTMTAGTYEITAVDVANNRWTLDRSAGTAAQTGTGRMGGAWASLGRFGELFAAQPVTGYTCWIRGGTYTLTSSSANVSGGRYSGQNNFAVYVNGYGTVRGDTGRPIISAGAITGIDIITAGSTSDNSIEVKGVILDGNSQSNVSAVNLQGGAGKAFNCEARNCLHGFSFGRVSNCVSDNCTGIGFRINSVTYLCTAKDCGTGFGFIALGSSHYYGLAYGGTTGVESVNQPGALFFNITCHGNSSHGFSTNQGHVKFVNCLATQNGGYGFSVSSTTQLQNCGSWNNTSGRVNGTSLDFSGVSVTDGDPYENSAGDDYRLNNTALRGALLRDAGIGMPGQTDNRDIGAVHHSDPTGVIYRGGAMTGGLV